jgi:NADH-quinone oxidoreductase subunit N
MEMKDLIQIEIPKLALFVPELIVLITGFVLFSLDIIYKRLSHTLAISVSVIGYTLALLYLVFNFDLRGETFYGLYVRDSFSSLLQVFMILLTIILLALPFSIRGLKGPCMESFITFWLSPFWVVWFLPVLTTCFSYT